MTKENLFRTAYEWLRTRKEMHREEAEKSAVLCAEFAELIYMQYRQESEAYKKLAEEAWAYAPPKPIIISRA